MADNVVADAGTGGATFAADDIGSVHFPRIKLVHGADGVNDGDVSDANPLPVDDAGGSLTIDNAHLTSLGGCVGGTELQVDVVAALPAGTNAIGKLAANSGVDIGDVDVLSVIPGTGATNLGKAADGASGATDTGVAPLAVRDDALAALTPIEGDYVPLRVDANGALWVIPSGTVAISAASLPLPSGAATSAKQDTEIASLATLAGAVAGTEMQVDVLTLPALPAGTNNIGDVDVLTVPADPFGVNADAASATGSISAKLRFIAGTGIPITGTVTVGSHAVTNAGTFAVQIDGAALTSLQLLDDGMVVEDAAAAADPTGMMMMAVRDDEVGSTAVTTADGDVVSLRTDKFGCLKTTQIPDATSEFKYAIIDAATSGDNTLVAAACAGVKHRVVAALLVAAGTVNARFESGAGGTALTGQMNLVANTGFVLPYNPAGWFETADATLLNLELSAAISVDGCLTYVDI